MKIRLLGAEFHDIRQYAAEDDGETGRPWNVSDRQLWRYVAAADALLHEYLEKDHHKLFNRHIGMRRALYARAVEGGDWKAALSIAKDEAELYGMYPPKRIAPTSPDGTRPYDGGLATLVSELQAAVERLRQEAGDPPFGDAAPGPAGEVAGGPESHPDPSTHSA
jgi:hypothetical protein